MTPLPPPSLMPSPSPPPLAFLRRPTQPSAQERPPRSSRRRPTREERARSRPRAQRPRPSSGQRPTTRPRTHSPSPEERTRTPLARRLVGTGTGSRVRLASWLPLGTCLERFGAWPARERRRPRRSSPSACLPCSCSSYCSASHNITLSHTFALQALSVFLLVPNCLLPLLASPRTSLHRLLT